MDFKNGLSRIRPFLTNSAPTAWAQSPSLPGLVKSPPLGLWLRSLALQPRVQRPPEVAFADDSSRPSVGTARRVPFLRTGCPRAAAAKPHKPGVLQQELYSLAVWGPGALSRRVPGAPPGGPGGQSCLLGLLALFSIPWSSSSRGHLPRVCVGVCLCLSVCHPMAPSSKDSSHWRRAHPRLVRPDLSS